MPEWLLKEENYIPQYDRDTFINKSILSLLGILSKIKLNSGYKSNELRVNAFLKLAGAFLLILMVSLSRSIVFVSIVIIFLLSILSLMRASEIIKVLKITAVVSLFTVVILVPSLFWGNYFSILFITPKVFASVMTINILSYSTKWDSVTKALKIFRIPDIFIFVAEITVKYIVLLGDISLNMLYSLKLRSVGKNRAKYTSLSGIAGTMFIRSRDMAEEMNQAMECRGFTGEYSIKQKFAFSVYDFVFMLITIAMILVFIYFWGISK